MNMRRLHLAVFLLTLLGCHRYAYAGCPDGVCLVPAGGDLQAALNLASCGDTIKLQDGASWRGPFTLPSKNPCTTYTTLTRQGAQPEIFNVIPACYQQGPSFAAEQARKAACFAALKAAYETNAPKLYTDEAAARQGIGVPLGTAFDADYWRVTGIEIHSTSAIQDPPVYALVTVGLSDPSGSNVTSASQLPNHIVFDRVSLHGNRSGSLVRAILGNGDHIQMINSLCYDVHYSNDSQCFMAYNGNGPFLIENNYLSAAGENILFGGADPTIPGLIPSDIIQTRNYMTKEWEWWQDAAKVGYTFGGTAWSTKNVTECKNCQRNAIYGNVIENSWAQNQNGGLILFQSVKDGPACTWCTVRDIQVFNNVIRNGGDALSVGGKGCGSLGCAVMARNISFHNNLAYNLALKFGPSGTSGASGFVLISGSSQGGDAALDGITIDHNTFDVEGTAGFLGGVVGDRFSRLTITNNLSRSRGGPGDPLGGFNSPIAAAEGNGGQDSFNTMAPGNYVVTNNAIVTATSISPAWPANNWFVQLPGYQQLAPWDALFANKSTSYTIAAGSPYKAGGARQSTDQKDIGADIGLLLSGAAGRAPAAAAPRVPAGLRIVP